MGHAGSARVASTMTRTELLSIIRFVHKTRARAVDCLGVQCPDPIWNMVLFLLQQHLNDRLVTTSSLVAASGVPYATALRRINALAVSGLIVRRPRTRTGRSFSLHPSRELMARAEQFARHVKSDTGRALGASSYQRKADGFYFGASYMAARIIPPPSTLWPRLAARQKVRALAYQDQTFLIMKQLEADLRGKIGSGFGLRIEHLDRLRALTLANAERAQSAFDIVAVDLPWIGEYGRAGVLRPLDDLITASHINPADFHFGVWQAGQYHGHQLGIPIEPIVELLFYRKDLFAKARLPPPDSTDAVIAAARALHRPRSGFSGIAWNGARGTPVGQAFIQMLGAFGHPPLDLRPVDGGFDPTHPAGRTLRPTIDTPQGRMTAEYLEALLEFSSPGVLAMEWPDGIREFSAGRCAMVYAWSDRAAAVEFDARSPARGNVGYLPHPRGPQGTNISPIGGAVFGIPANLAPERVERAFRVIEWLTSPEMMKYYTRHGSPVSPRFSVSADPEVLATCPVIQVVDELARSDRLHLWPRPPLPGITQVIGVLGEEIHDMLCGRQSPATAVARSQQRAEALLRPSTHDHNALKKH
jgi:multiple sugar transport system substrate-binding protein